MKTINMKTLTMGLLGVVALTSGMRDARATDAKVYPASLCATSNWGDHIFREQLSGGVTVDHDTELWCPMIGDNESTTGSSGLKTVLVYMRESGDTPLPGNLAHTTCTIRSYGSLGGVPYDTNTKTASGSGNLALPNIPLTKTTAPTPISPRYVLDCKIKAGSTMFEYEIEEN